MPLALLKARPAEEREWAFNLSAQTSPVLTTADIRGEIRERLGISLGSDSAYSDFRSWQFRQRQWDVLGDINEMDEATLKDRFPNLSADKIRDAVIKRQFAVAELLNDPAHTLKVIKASQAESTGRTKASLDQEKLQLAKEAEARAKAEHLLNREKFEFDAVQAAIKHAAEIKTISANRSLSSAEKVNQIRQKLFGTLPAANPAT